jgi:uncharacterized secreted protein with C-terminal beta-propeller domain
MQKNMTTPPSTTPENWMKEMESLLFDYLPKTYAGLCDLHRPTPIQDHDDMERVIELIELMAERELNPEQEEYLRLMTALLEKYQNPTQPAKKTERTEDYFNLGSGSFSIA